jgi:peptidyl-prolyl cis-trans isomerase SurA
MLKFNKVSILLILLVLSNSHAYSTGDDSEVVDRIVAVVNEDIISLSELSKAVGPYAEKIKSAGYPPEKEREMLFRVREDMIEQLINQKLTDQESRKYNISVSDKELDNAIERAKEINHYTDEDLRRMLAEENISMESYRGNVKEHLIRSKLLNYAVKSRIIITKDEITKYYNSNIEKYRGEKEYHLKNIIIRTGLNISYDEKQKIRLKMEEIYTELKNGELFEIVGKKNADSEFGIKSIDLGTFKHNELSPEIQEAINGLKTGEHSKLVETQAGYQIIYIEKVEEKPDKTIEEVTPEIQDILFGERVEKKFESWIDELRKKSHIKIIK